MLVFFYSQCAWCLNGCTLILLVIDTDHTHLKLKSTLGRLSRSLCTVILWRMLDRCAAETERWEKPHWLPIPRSEDRGWKLWLTYLPLAFIGSQVSEEIGQHLDLQRQNFVLPKHYWRLLTDFRGFKAGSSMQRIDWGKFMIFIQNLLGPAALHHFLLVRWTFE